MAEQAHYSQYSVSPQSRHDQHRAGVAAAAGVPAKGRAGGCRVSRCSPHRQHLRQPAQTPLHPLNARWELSPLHHWYDFNHDLLDVQSMLKVKVLQTSPASCPAGPLPRPAAPPRSVPFTQTRQWSWVIHNVCVLNVVVIWIRTTRTRWRDCWCRCGRWRAGRGAGRGAPGRDSGRSPARCAPIRLASLPASSSGSIQCRM